MMDSLPPNDPNRNNANHNRSSAASAPPAGKQLEGDGAARNGGANGGPINVMGDLRDAPAVAVMFMIGVLTYFLQETCTC
jgi:hypothetical protein